MDKVDMIKEEIRRRMNDAVRYQEKWLQAFRDAEDGGMYELRMASQYDAELSALTYLLQYIECEVD